MSEPLSPARLRAISLGLVLVFLVLTHLLLRDASLRAEWQYRVVIALGWGHLLAAVAPRGWDGATRRAWLLGLCASSWLFVLYAALLERWPGMVVLALAASAWHTFENDRVLGGIRPGGLSLPPLSRRPRDHLGPLVATACVGWLALRTRQGSALLLLAGEPGARVLALLPALRGLPVPGLSDLFVLVTLHHLLTWLLLAGDRLRRASREGRDARTLRRRLLATHVGPLALGGVLVAVPSPALDPLRSAMLAPGVYLFWSVLHVAQTAWRRGLEGPRAA